MTALGVVLLLAGILGILLIPVGAYILFSNNSQFSRILGSNYALNLLTALISIANLLLVGITIVSLYYAHQANARAERVFVGQNRPLIDLTPIGIVQQGEGAATFLSIVNHSGFPAYDIGFDIKYGDNDWIREWLKAREEKSSKGNAQGIVQQHFYRSAPTPDIPILASGKSTEYKGLRGSYNLERGVCGKRQGILVLIRVTWKNETGHVFDEVHRYRLICTTDYDGAPSQGRSFTFIPEGVQSRKDATSSRIGEDET